MDGTILGQGSFISAGTATTVQIPSNADWMRVFNYTLFGTAGDGANFYPVYSYWQRGMAAGTGVLEYYASASNVLSGDTYASGGFTLYDPTQNVLGPLYTVAGGGAGVSNATRPIVTTNNTYGLAAGQVVRLSNAQSDISGPDFVVGAVTANTNFTLLYSGNALANIPGAAGTAASQWRVVNTDPLYYPRKRYITDITQAPNAQVSTSVAHGLTVGQEVRFFIPAACGMVQLSYGNYGVVAITILSIVDDYNFTINVDTTSFNAFTWPTVSSMPSSFPIVNPVGEDTAASLASTAAQTPVVGGVQIYNTNTGILADSTVNTGFLGMTLGASASATVKGALNAGPAGLNTNVIYWTAGKSTYGGL